MESACFKHCRALSKCLYTYKYVYVSKFVYVRTYICDYRWTKSHSVHVCNLFLFVAGAGKHQCVCKHQGMGVFVRLCLSRTQECVYVTHCNTHCNPHCITHCNAHCSAHYNAHCNTHCNTHCIIHSTHLN